MTMGFWETLRDWAPLSLLLLAIMAPTMGFWIRAELLRKITEFEKNVLNPIAIKLGEELQALGARMDQQAHNQDLSLLEVKAAVAGTNAAVMAVQKTAEQLSHGWNAASVTIGKHEEQIATLVRRHERLEVRTEAVEHNIERRQR